VRASKSGLLLAGLAVLASSIPGCGNDSIFLERVISASGGTPPGVGGGTGGAPGGGSEAGGTPQMAAGGSETGGANSGGAPSSGGVPPGSGGDEGMAGAPPVEPPPGPCATELDCRIPLAICPGWVERCASCVKHSECPSGLVCDLVEFRCVPVCKFDWDCPPSRPHCDAHRGVCAQCDYGYRCPGVGQQCVGASCFSCDELPWCNSAAPSEGD